MFNTSKLSPRETEAVSHIVLNVLLSLAVGLVCAAITHASSKAGFDLFRDASPLNAFALASTTFLIYQVLLSFTFKSSKLSAFGAAIDMWVAVYVLAPCLAATASYYWNLLFPQ